MYIWSAVAAFADSSCTRCINIVAHQQSAVNQDHLSMHCTDQVGYWLCIVSSWNCIAGCKKCIYRTASLLRPARCYAPPPPPPPNFRAKLLYRVFYLHYTPPPPPPPPPRAARAGLRYCSSCTCTRVASVEELYLCIKRVENSLRTGLGLFR